jgi:sigma-B regulation protein RsbU (phosphoserine phosphatase)
MAQYKKQQQDIRFEKHLTLTNNIEEVPQLAAFVDEVCETAGLDMSTTTNMNIALEEAVVNVMSYAYPAGSVGEVQIDALLGDKELCFVIRDKGKPFDPTAQDETDTTLSLEERPIGGLGIYLVNTIMDHVSYAREDGKNILSMNKLLKKNH